MSFSSKSRHFRALGYVLNPMLSDLLRFTVSSENPVSVSADFTGVMGCLATFSFLSGNLDSLQTYLFGLINVNKDYFMLARATVCVIILSLCCQSYR